MPPDRERGFTLVEVLVALIVTSLILGVAMNATLQAKARAITASDKEAALLLAGSLIEKRQAIPFSTRMEEGSTGQLDWRVNESALAVDHRGLFVLSRIEILVEGRKGAILAKVETRRLKASPRP